MISETREHDFKEMMRSYLKEESLEGENKYECSKCGKKSELTIKRSKWHRLPPVLIFRMNRFSNKSLGKMPDKVSIIDEFVPEEVFAKACFDGGLEDIKGTGIMAESRKTYMLYCMIIHRGATPKEGHYFTFVRDFRDNAWLCIDDKDIQKRDLEYDFAKEETPYIFFYIRKD